MSDLKERIFFFIYQKVSKNTKNFVIHKWIEGGELSADVPAVFNVWEKLSIAAVKHVIRSGKGKGTGKGKGKGKPYNNYQRDALNIIYS